MVLAWFLSKGFGRNLPLTYLDVPKSFRACWQSLKVRPKTLLQGVVGWEGWCASGLMGFADADIDGWTRIHQPSSMIGFSYRCCFFQKPHADLPLTHFHIFRILVKAKEATTLFISQCFVCQSFFRIHEDLHMQLITIMFVLWTVNSSAAFFGCFFS